MFTFKLRVWNKASLRIIGTGLITLTVLYVCVAIADDGSPSFLQLDNRRFIGPMGVKGDPNPANDEFMFEDGKFVSKSCLEWGFSPARYWVRNEKDGLHFLAELTSRDHGEMRYEGVFDGQQIKGKVMWKKERWYWTIQREYRFTGRLAVPVK